MASRDSRRILASTGDLTANARIRVAALELFAARGVAGTSIRDIAREAGVSAGLVQHHFSTKAGLRAAVDAYVVETTAAAFADLPDPRQLEQPFDEVAKRITGLVASHPSAVRYVARAVGEGDRAGIEVFRELVRITREQLDQLENAGRIDPEHDLDWVALHIVIFNLGSVLFDAGVAAALDEPFSTLDGLWRWHDASTRLLARGLEPRPGAGRRRG